MLRLLHSARWVANPVVPVLEGGVFQGAHRGSLGICLTDPRGAEQIPREVPGGRCRAVSGEGVVIWAKISEEGLNSHRRQKAYF